MYKMWTRLTHCKKTHHSVNNKNDSETGNQLHCCDNTCDLFRVFLMIRSEIMEELNNLLYQPSFTPVSSNFFQSTLRKLNF